MAVKKDLCVNKRIQWAPKVSRNKIRRLYETDARGIVDEELIDEVAYAFYARCQSILTVTEASSGKVKCLSCGNIILRETHEKEQVLKCDRCSWEITWGEYYRSYHRKQLHGGGAVEFFEDFVKALPKAQTPQEKMILIDQIIHECHKFFDRKTEELKYVRPVAVNLIQGKMTRIIAFLDDLAYGRENKARTKNNKMVWRKKIGDKQLKKAREKMPKGISESQKEKISETDAIVYIASTGSKYHRKGCQYVKPGAKRVKKSEAKKCGYTECQVCQP